MSKLNQRKKENEIKCEFQILFFVIENIKHMSSTFITAINLILIIHPANGAATSQNKFSFPFHIPIFHFVVFFF